MGKPPVSPERKAQWLKVQAVRSEQCAERKRRVLIALAQGCKPSKLYEETGVKTSLYERWRQMDPKFRAAAIAARNEQVVPGSRPHGDTTFAGFRKTYFGMDTFPQQLQLVDVLNSVKPREITLVNVHPEAGKTTTIIDWICQKIAEDPNQRNVYVSRSISLGRKVVGQIQRRLKDDRAFPAFIAKYGPFYKDNQEKQGKPWNKDAFTVWKAAHDEKDFTVEARGWNSAAYGSRIDTLIIDDVQSVETVSQTAAILDSLRSTYFTRGRRMRIVIVGTRLAPGDIYERLLDADIVTHHVELAAADIVGKPHVPEWWVDEEERRDLPPEAIAELARERLAAIRHQVGERAWWSEYMQLPEADSIATFTGEMIDKSKDRNRKVGQRSDQGLPIWCGLDPALGGVNAFTIAAVGADRLEVLDVIADKGLASNEDIINRFAEIAGMYRVDQLIIEINGVQKGIARDERFREVARGLGCRVMEHTTLRNKTDPIFGVAAMAGAFQRGEISFPAADAEALDRMAPMFTELRAWRPDIPAKILKQDRIMSLWFVYLNWARSRANSTAETRSTWGRRGTMWKPASYQRVKVGHW